jgi:tRNA-dihydrouridine synthase
LKDLEYSEIERPIVAQFFTSRPENMEKAARLALELGFDGVDINMGCPDKSIEKQGAGAALIKNPSLAKEIILAAKRGVNDEVPVSVKTRIGYNKDEIETWIPNLLEVSPAVITIHARTRKEVLFGLGAQKFYVMGDSDGTKKDADNKMKYRTLNLYLRLEEWYIGQEWHPRGA